MPSNLIQSRGLVNQSRFVNQNVSPCLPRSVSSKSRFGGSAISLMNNNPVDVRHGSFFNQWLYFIFYVAMRNNTIDNNQHEDTPFE